MPSARAAGGLLAAVPRAGLAHRLGSDGRRVWLGRWRYFPHHSPLRHYYMLRNSLALRRLAHVTPSMGLWLVLRAYALAVDPRDDTIWACGSNSDTMMHLLPATGEVVTYQLPTHVTFCREISFAADGSVWTSYSNYPSASIEGGSSAFVRIKPLD